MKIALSLGSVAALALMVSQGFAADLPSKKKPVAPAPVVAAATLHNWGGAYGGVFGSYGFGKSSVSNILFEGEDAGVPAYDVSSTGFGLGADLGYNVQSGSFVYGAEIDGSWLNQHGTDSQFADIYNFTSETDVKWLATARLRAGIAMDKVLIYATGGLAFGSVTSTINDTYGDTVVVTHATKEQVGWTVGAGAEYAITERLSLNADYLYYDLGKTGVSHYQGDLGWNPITVDVATTGSVVRVGLNVKF